MFRVFLAEDEQNLRETLRDKIPWEQCGCRFAGEAEDGEIALPRIRQVKPDILIADMQMPFMDGLSLSDLVLKEFPQTKIILLCEDASFESAQQAMKTGVTLCLRKPVARGELVNALKAVCEKAGRERNGATSRFRLEAQEYEQYIRRRFFERMVSGQLSVQQIYEEAFQLDLDLRAQSYTLALFSIPPGNPDASERLLEAGARIRCALLEHFLKYSEYILFQWDWSTCAVLIKGSQDKMPICSARCIDAVQAQYSASSVNLPWYIAVGTPTQRLSALPGCFEEVSRLWAHRYILPAQHILTPETVDFLAGSGDGGELAKLDPAKVNPSLFLNFMQGGQAGEIPQFVEEFMQSVNGALNFSPFCQYLMLSIRFTAAEYARSLNVSHSEFLQELECLDMVGHAVTASELKHYMTEILRASLDWRDSLSGSQIRRLLKQAASYIDRHFTEPDLSLNRIAREVNVSANYLSAVFSQEMGRTLTEYITGRRMERARELLRNTDQRSSEVALSVGYRDPRYFSALFKKRHGCTPRDYRKSPRSASLLPDS